MLRIGICVLSTIILALGCVTRTAVKNDNAIEQLSKATYSEMSGDSYEEAVKITGVEKQSQGVEAEYGWISQKHGVKDKDWKVVGQVKLHEDGKTFDVIEVSVGTGGDMRIYYFDVSDFSWKRE